MPAPITVLIPTLNAARGLGGTLASLIEGIEAGLIRELVVADGGSTDQTQSIVEDAGAVWVPAAGGRGGQLRTGAGRARGDWLLILHADTQLSDGWSEAVEDHIASGTDRAGYFKLAFRSPAMAARITAGWANLRSRLAGLPYGDQGLLIHRDALKAAGGIPDIPLMEDVALARALKGRLVALNAVAWTSPARYQAEGWIRRGARNLVTLARYLAGADPKALAKSYNRKG
ncbi:MAG: TIGR04283 family arsenosugar biosynthesis glycosyltransferase [Pseudomonadota bacterium]